MCDVASGVAANETQPLMPQEKQTRGATIEVTGEHRVAPTSTFSNVLQVLLLLAGVGAVITLAVVANNEKPDNVRCSFAVPFLTWAEYRGEGCPRAGKAFKCEKTEECRHLIPQYCVHGGTDMLSCLETKESGKVCGYITSTIPSLTYGAGYCDHTTPYSTCALCTGDSCGSGVALCVKSESCSVEHPFHEYGDFNLQCHKGGNYAEL